MKLPEILTEMYRNEYETTDITKEELCLKYSIEHSNIPDIDSWTKPTNDESQEPKTTIDNSDIILDTTIVTPTLDTKKIKKLASSKLVKTPAEPAVADKIKDFKEFAIDHALHFIKHDAEFAEVKEFKDMVAIVDSIEKSYKDTKDQGPTVNILIQNLAEKFKDDC